MDGEVKESILELSVTVEELAELNTLDCEGPENFNNLHGQSARTLQLTTVKDSCRVQSIHSPDQNSIKCDQQEVSAKLGLPDQLGKKTKFKERKKKSSASSKQPSEEYSSATIVAEPVHYRNPVCIGSQRKEVSKIMEQAKKQIEEKMKNLKKSKASKNTYISDEAGEKSALQRKVTNHENTRNFKTSNDSPTASNAHPSNEASDKLRTLSHSFHPPGDPEWNDELKIDKGNASSSYHTGDVNTQFSIDPSNSYPWEGSNISAEQNEVPGAHDPQGMYNQSGVYHNPDQYGTYYSYDNSSSGYPSTIYHPTSNYANMPNNSAGFIMGYGNYGDNFDPHSQSTLGMTKVPLPNIPSAGSVDHISMDFKAVTHPLLPSAQLPVVQAIPLPPPQADAGIVALSHVSTSDRLLTEKPTQAAKGMTLSKLSTKEKDLLEKFLQQKSSNILAGTSRSEDDQALIEKALKGKDYDAGPNPGVELLSKRPKGEISIVVENIHPEVNLSGFKKVLQSFGRLPGFSIHKRAADAPSSSLTATFANIEGASRAVRVLSKLTIGNLKVSAKYEGDIKYHKPLTKLEQSRDKDLKSTIKRLLNHEDSMRPVKFDDLEDSSAEKITLIAKTKAAITKAANLDSTMDSISSSDNDRTTCGITLLKDHPTSDQSNRCERDKNYTSRSISHKHSSSGPNWCSKINRTPEETPRSVKSKMTERYNSSERRGSSERSNQSTTLERQCGTHHSRTEEKRNRSNRSKTPARSDEFSKPGRRSHRSQFCKRLSRSNRSNSPQKKQSSTKCSNKNNHKEYDSDLVEISEKHLEQQRKKEADNPSRPESCRSRSEAMTSAPHSQTGSLEADFNPPVLNGYNIHVDGGLKKLSKIAVNEINNIFGGIIEPVFQKVWHLSIPEQRKAQLLVQVLHGWRLLDDRLQVSFADGTSSTVDCSPNEVLVWGEAAATALKLHDSAISQLLAINLDKTLDIFQFKLEPCQEVHCKNAFCNRFHSLKDKRRDLRMHFYRPLKCPEGWQGRPCPRGDNCELCHNEAELQLHSDTFRVKICPQNSCKEQLCPYAHKETPQLFYHRQWKDLFVEGLHNTLYYVAGALHNLCKLDDDAVTGLQVLAVTSSANIALHITGLLQDTAVRHGVKVTAIATGEEDPSGAHALFGTLEGLLTLLDKRGVAPLVGLCALIIDDASYILQDKNHTVTLLRLLQLIKDIHKDIGLINKVLIAQDLPKKGVSLLEIFLSTTFTVVGSRGSQCSSTTVTKKVDSTEVYVQPVQSKQSIIAIKEIKQNGEKINPNEAEKRSSKSIKKTSEGGHFSVNEDGNKMSRLTALLPPAKRFKNFASETAQNTSLKQFTPEQYCAEEKALREELDDIYAAYIDVPEMHPSYSEKYNEFLKTRGSTGFVSEAEWAEYWRTELEQMKKKELTVKKEPIIANYKKMLASKATVRSNVDSVPTAIKADVPVSTVSSHSDESDHHTSVTKLSTDYSVLDSFVILEGVTNHIGLLGAALKSLIDLARNAGSTTKKAFDLLLQDDNVTLMKLCISKLRSELVQATPPFSLQLNRGVEHAEKLLKFAAEQVKKVMEVVPHNGDYGLGLQAIAKATEGQSSSYILNFIKYSLDLQGAVYDKKDLNELFLAVSSLHFETSLNAPPQSLNDFIPELKSRVQGMPKSNSISTEITPLSIQQTRNLISSQFGSIEHDQGSNENMQVLQNTRRLSDEDFNLNLHSQFARAHESHSKDPLKYPKEVEQATSQPGVLKEGHRSMKLHNEPSSKPKKFDTVGNIDLEKLLRSGSSTDMLKNILEKIPPNDNHQQLTREPYRTQCNATTQSFVSPQSSYQAVHQNSVTSSQFSSTAIAAPHYDKAKSYGSYHGPADPPVFDSRDESSRHYVSTETSNRPQSSRESVIAQSQFSKNRDQSYYAESYSISDSYQAPSFSGKRVNDDEMYSRTLSSYHPQQQFSKQADTSLTHSGASSSHVAYQSCMQLASSATSSQQNPTYKSSLQPTRSETSSQVHPIYHSSWQSTSFSSGPQQHPAYPLSLQSTSSAIPSNDLAYNSGVQSSTSSNLSKPSDFQSTRSLTESQQLLPHQSITNSKTPFLQNNADPAGVYSTSSTVAGFKEDSKANSASWFTNKVKTIVNLPNLCLSKFNEELATILKDKPTHYKFSKSDLLIVKELQTLGSLNVSEALFISTLKGKFL